MSKQIKKFAVCVRNEGYEAALELRKIYQVIPAGTTVFLVRAGVVREGTPRAIDARLGNSS